MKRLNKILCGFALSTMAAGVGVAIGTSLDKTVKASGVKAADFETADTSVSVVSMTAGYNGHEAPNEAYLVIKLSENDYSEAAVKTFAYAGQDGYHPEDYNFLDKIYVSNDRTNWTPLSTARAEGNVFFVDNGSGVGGNLRFQLGAVEGDYKAYITRFVKVEEGCEFPSYDYIANSGTAKKYVQKDTVIFDSLYCDDDFSTRLYRDQYGVSELTTIKELATDPSNKTIWVRTTVNDYESNCSGDGSYHNTGVANASLYNVFSQVKINGTTPLLEATDGSMMLDRWERPTVSFTLGNGATNFDGVETITIPALTQFPSYSKGAAGEPNGIIYCTENDLNLNYGIEGVGHNETSTDAAAKTWYQATFVKADGVFFENVTEANPFIGVTLSATDYEGCSTTNINTGDNYTLETLQKTFKGENILMDGNPLSINGFGESFANLFGNQNSFAIRFKGSSNQLNTSKVTIKKGAWFPSRAYIGSKMMAAPTCYIVDEDCALEKDLYVKNGKFQKHLVENEFATTEALQMGIGQFRYDGTSYFFQLGVNNSGKGYEKAGNNTVSPMDLYLNNINFYGKMHFQFYDGSVITIDKNTFTQMSLYQWGDSNSLFFKINPNIIPNDKIKYVKTVQYDPGFEVPSYDRSIKYQLAAQTTKLYADGTVYEEDNGQPWGGFAPWRVDANQNRNLGQTVSLSKKGSITGIKPHYDADPSILYLECPAYESQYEAGSRNLDFSYKAMFDLNFYGKIKLIKDGVETPLSSLPLKDSAFGNLYDRKYANIGIRNLSNVTSYDAIKIEAGLQIPVIPSNDFADITLEYYEVEETTVWRLNSKKVYGEEISVQFGENTPITTADGEVLSALMPALPALPAAAEGCTNYWVANGKPVEITDTISGNTVYTAYDSELVAVRPSVGDMPGIPTKSTNLTIKLEGSDYHSTDKAINVHSFETFSNFVELYDIKGNKLSFGLNGERYIWNNGRLLLQLLDPDQAVLHNVYKIVLKAGAKAPSVALMSTGEGPTYTLDKDYSFVRFLGTDNWVEVNEPSEVISTKVISVGFGINDNPAGSYNVILGLENYTAGNLVTSPKMILDAAKHIHFYDASGEELAISFNTEQYSSWDGRGVLYQIIASDVPAKVVFDKDMLIPSAAYAEGSGAMLQLSEEAVLLRQTDGSYQFVKEYTFDGESVYFAYGQCPDSSKIPAPAAKESSATTDYVGYWKDSEGNALDLTAPVTSDMAFTTDYTEETRKYTVTYLDETGAVIETVSVANGSEYTIKDAPTKTGYNGSWAVESGDVTIEGGKFTMPTSNVTLKATFRAKSFNLSFEGLSSIKTVTYGQPIGQLPDVPALEHYKDGVWMIGDTVLTANTVWTFTEDMKATPSYTKESYTVAFDVDGGTEVASQTVEYLGKLQTVADPTKTGYTFGGWTLNGEDVDLSTYEVTGNVTFVAKWTLNTYTVTFQNGDSVHTATVNHGGLVEEPTMPVKEGYTFGGWTLNGEVFDFDTPVTGDMTLVASWTLNSYTVTFVDGETTLGTQTINHGGLVEEPEIAPVKEGYTFEGWLVNGEAYDFSTPVTGDLTIEATWKEIPAEPEEPAKKGCGSSVVAASAIVTLVAGLGVALVASKKKED